MKGGRQQDNRGTATEYMTCSSCKYLNENKKLDGKVSGCKYFCYKNKCYVGGDNHICNNYQNCFRSNSRCDEIYDEGVNFYDDTHSVTYYLFILLIIIIIFIIARLCNPELFPF